MFLDESEVIKQWAKESLGRRSQGQDEFAGRSATTLQIQVKRGYQSHFRGEEKKKITTWLFTARIAGKSHTCVSSEYFVWAKIQLSAFAF